MCCRTSNGLWGKKIATIYFLCKPILIFLWPGVPGLAIVKDEVIERPSYPESIEIATSGKHKPAAIVYYNISHANVTMKDLPIVEGLPSRESFYNGPPVRVGCATRSFSRRIV